jgi:hypothetical protein
MAITLNDHSEGSLTLCEFIDYVDKSFNELTVESLIQIAPSFAALSRNRTFLEDAIIEELRNLAHFQQDSPYSSQSLHLGGVPLKFYIRANVWLPQRELHPINSAGEADLYSFDFAHDHNFDFLTVGYLGSGYETDIYEYDVDAVRGKVGEPVIMRFLETTTLSRSKMMIYRASKDIHVQKFPQEFSISLNLLIPGRMPVRDQYAFDLRTKTISGIVRSDDAGRSLLLAAGVALRDREIAGLIHEIADNHHCSRTRQAANHALATSSG